MAQLPPKIPNMTPTWPDFSHQKIPSMGILAPPNATTTTTTNATNVASATQNPSWVDEFLDFSSARRGTHRRSVSDSIAFLEAPMLEECRGTGGPAAVVTAGSSGHNSSTEFDKFDDEQFMSMFSDDISNAVAPAPSSSTPSTPSDHNSINDEKETTTLTDQKNQKNMRNESDEVQSQCQWETQTPPSATNTTTNDRIIDPKRVKR